MSAAQRPPLQGGMLWVAAIVLALANFMVILDTTIANVSVPHIAGNLAVSPNEGAWVITSYAVAEAVIVPLTGWLAGRFGSVLVFLVCLVAFSCFSMLCGMAWSLESLVLFRVLQGLAGGPMMPLSQTLLRHIFPPEKQNGAIALWSMTTVIAPIVGPIVGGTLCDSWGWPWAFYINLPIGLVVGWASFKLLTRYETQTRKIKVDYIGLALLVTWVGALQLMLDKGRELDWFSHPFIIGCAITSAIGFVSFLIWELSEEHPIVNLRLFARRSYAVGVAVSSIAFSAFFASIVLLPLWLQTNQGYTATWAGYAIAANGIFATILSPIVAKFFMPRFDARLLVCFGMTVLAGVSAMRGAFSPDIDFFHAMLPQLVQGIGMPFFFIPLMSITMSAVPKHEVASASGLFNFVRTLAVGFATALVTTIWADGAAANRTDLVGHLSPYHTPYNEAMAGLHAAGQPSNTALAILNQTLNSQAITASAVHVFQGAVYLFLFCAMMIWVAKVPKKAPVVDGH